MPSADAAPETSLAFYRFGSPALRDERLLACCTTRRGGVSEGPYATLNLAFHVDDDPEAVLANRERVAAALGLDLDAFVVPEQVHREHVQLVGAADHGRGARAQATVVPATDALVTRDPGTVLAVMLADCVPVVVFDPDTPAIGLAHAGWGGTVRHVVRRTIEAMQAAWGTDPARVAAGVGPSIGPDSYEVGPEVADPAARAFPHADVLRPSGDGRFLLDLWAANVADLVDAGVPQGRIEVAGLDVLVDRERFFSHRRDGRPRTGRFMAIAMLREAGSGSV